MAIFWQMLWYCPEYDETSTLSLFFIRMLFFRPKLILGWKYSCIILKLYFMTFPFYPEKTADIWRRYHWFPRQMTSEKRAQKFHTDDASLLSSGQCFWLVVPRGKVISTNKKHYPDVGSDASSVRNFYSRFSEVIWRGNQW